MDLYLIISLGLLTGCILGLSWFAGSDAPYVPTKMKLIRDVLKAAGLKKNKVFYELGSGDGRVVFEAAKMGAQSFGVEQSWLRVWFSRLKARQDKLKLANFFHGNIFDRKYFPADVVYIYLLPQGIARLEKKLPKELKPGATIITQTYHFKGIPPFKKIDNFWIYRI